MPENLFVVMMVYSNEYQIIAEFLYEKDARDYVAREYPNDSRIRIMRDITEEK
jgi:hypothetical protein